MYIKVYVTEPEKETLSKLAEKKSTSLSQLVYSRLLPLLHDELADMAAFDSLETTPNAALGKTYTLHLTGAEYALLQKQAGGTPLSVYIRYLIFRNHSPAVVEIASDDIAALTLKVSAYLEQLRNFTAALYIRNELYDADRNRLMEIASGTEKALRQTATYTKANRASIRASGVRWLKKELRRILKEKGIS